VKELLPQPPIASVRAWQRVVAMSSDVAVLVSPDGTLLWVSPNSPELAGYAVEEVIGQDGMQFVHPDDLPDVRAYLKDAATTPGRHDPIEFRLRARTGGWVWVEDRITNLLDDPEIGGLVAYLRDVTDRRSMTVELELAEQRYRAIVEAADEGIGVIESTGTIVFANRQLVDLVGDDIQGANILDYVDPVDSPGAAAWTGDLTNGERISVRLRHSSGRLIYSSLAAVPFDPDSSGNSTTLVMVRDDTARHGYEQELAQANLHDALTGLPNRQLLGHRLSELRTSLDPGRRAALLLIDIDQFSVVNQSLGPRVGDAVLAEVAMRLVNLASADDAVARVGGDEFALLSLSASTGLQACELAERVMEATRAPIMVDGTPLVLTVAVGIALTDGVDIAAAQSRALAAVVTAKRQGRDQLHLDDGDDRPVAIERWRIETELRAAAETEEIFVVYQPIVDLVSGLFIGAEALVRWTSPVRGPVPPDQFIPVAEDSGLMKALGQRVLAVACHDAANWPLSPDGGRLPVSVNISAKQLTSPSLTDAILQTVYRAGLQPADLILEVTETAILSDMNAATAVLTQLHNAGIGIHIDDFGTGYASMLYLRHFPVDAVKIDRQFVSGLGVNDEDAAIITATLSLARGTGRSVVAEGVETDQQAEFLRAAGCRSAQGFLWSRPLPQDQWLALQASVARSRATADRPGRNGASPSPEVIARVIELHHRGTSAASIAAALNRDGIPAGSASRWHRVSVERLLARLLRPQSHSSPRM
jgi:diguanylate cyclase (GGDEF)-like protein/PAS domain S-box-containing protein